MSDFILPDIGEGIVECEVVKWLIAEGDEIEEDQPVVEVMTDKALVEITAPEAGRVTRLYCKQQENAQVHAPLFAYTPSSQGDEVAENTHEAADDQGNDNQKSNKEPSATATPPKIAPQPAEAEPATGFGLQERIPASPAVRRLVRELGVTLAEIPGSGKDGRVLKEDIRAFEKSDENGARTQTAAPTEHKPTGEVRVESIKGVQAVMARRMVESATTIPHFSYGDEIDVTELLALRERLKPQAEQHGTRLTLMALIMKAMALAVQAHPVLNSRLEGDGKEIHYQPHCNIGMAVDSQTGLIVPNVKRVEQLSVLEIAVEVARLTKAARDGRVNQADLKDGTISISNIGALGGTYAAPIINLPEVAIVALGRTQHLPRFDESGNVVSRAIMTITWSGDHRIIDGGTIARFCNLWKSYLQEPQIMLLHMT